MPHDMHGNLIEIGEIVVIQGKIVSIDSDGETGCNVTVDILNAEDEYTPRVAMNASAVQLTSSLPTDGELLSNA